MSDEIIYLHDELEGITKEITKTIKEIEKKKLKPEAKSEKVGAHCVFFRPLVCCSPWPRLEKEF